MRIEQKIMRALYAVRAPLLILLLISLVLAILIISYENAYKAPHKEIDTELLQSHFDAEIVNEIGDWCDFPLREKIRDISYVNRDVRSVGVILGESDEACFSSGSIIIPKITKSSNIYGFSIENPIMKFQTNFEVEAYDGFSILWDYHESEVSSGHDILNRIEKFFFDGGIPLLSMNVILILIILSSYKLTRDLALILSSIPDVYCQPVVNRVGNVAFYEILIRRVTLWGKVLTPYHFEFYLSNKYLAYLMTKYILCESLRYINIYNVRNVRLSINIPTHMVEDGKLLTLLNKFKIPQKLRACIKFEILEDRGKSDESLIAHTRALWFMGYDVYIDDFGTGTSGINRMSTLQIGGIKLDRSYVSKVLTEPRCALVIGKIYEAANDIGLKVVVEGIESREQFEILRDMGIEYFQGYYFAHPRPISSTFD
ncbi:EAL domain-containing protein [Vibrio vulnificus]|nr:EAL domain-containing protein [Vibrio vulnificus]HDU8731820.1 EAL domain-containing protein [Vibrio vulnificus]HDU8768374.1 EAL domain-containing protein [Vibrio vulnificus]